MQYFVPAPIGSYRPNQYDWRADTRVTGTFNPNEWVDRRYVGDQSDNGDNDDDNSII